MFVDENKERPSWVIFSYLLALRLRPIPLSLAIFLRPEFSCFGDLYGSVYQNFFLKKKSRMKSSICNVILPRIQFEIRTLLFPCLSFVRERHHSLDAVPLSYVQFSASVLWRSRCVFGTRMALLVPLESRSSVTLFNFGGRNVVDFLLLMCSLYFGFVLIPLLLLPYFRDHLQKCPQIHSLLARSQPLRTAKDHSSACSPRRRSRLSGGVRFDMTFLLSGNRKQFLDPYFFVFEPCHATYHPVSRQSEMIKSLVQPPPEFGAHPINILGSTFVLIWAC